MSLYDVPEIKVRVYSELSKFYVDVRMYQESVLWAFIFVVVIDIVSEFTRECELTELLCADDLIMMSQII